MKKKSVSLIIVIIILCLILLCGGGAYAYFFTDMFKTDKELFFKYILNNENLLEVLSFDELEAYGEKQETSPYTGSGYIKTNNNFDLTSIDSNTQNVLKDSNITFTSDVDKANNYVYSQIDFNYSDTESLSVEYVNSNDYYGLKIESILKKFLTIENNNLKDFTTNLGYESLVEYIPDEIDFDSLTSQSDIFTEDEKEELKTKYYNILSENFTDSMFTDSTSADGQTIYTLTITKTQLENLTVKLLEQLENDETIINKLKEYSVNNSGLTEAEADEYVVEIKEEIQSLIDELNENISSEESTEEVTTYTVNLYVQNKKMTKLELKTSDTRITLSVADNDVTIEIAETADTITEVSILDNAQTTSEDLSNFTIKLQKTTTDDTFEYRLVCNTNEETVVDFQIDFTGLSELTQVEEKSIITVNLGTGYELGYTYSNTKSFTETSLSDYVDESELYILNDQDNPAGTITTFSELLTELNSNQMEALGVETNPMVYYIPAIIPAAMTCSLATGDISNIMLTGEIGAIGLGLGLLIYNGNLSDINLNENDSNTNTIDSETILTSALDICNNIASTESLPEDLESVDDIDQYIINEINNYDWTSLSTSITCTATFISGESTIEFTTSDGSSLKGTLYYGTITWGVIELNSSDEETNISNEDEDENEITENVNTENNINIVNETVDEEISDNETTDEDTGSENEETSNTSTRITIE